MQQKRSATVEVEAAWGYTTPLLPENDKEWHTIGDGKRAIGMDGTPVLVRLVDRGTDVLHALKICKMPGCTSCTDGWAAARQKGFCCGRHQLEFERGSEFQAEIEMLLAADSEGREQPTTSTSGGAPPSNYSGKPDTQRCRAVLVCKVRPL
eukprot:COSAG01_NODE_3385_length_6155_cov_12.953269_1_plen_150_part_10